MSFAKGLGQNLWCFLAVYLSCSILQSIRGPFLSNGIQSIERQFQIPSSQSGTLLSASRIGYIPTVLLLAYFGSKGNRARWMGAGSIIVACGCLLAVLPNFIFPPKTVFDGSDTKFVLNAIFGAGNATSTQDVLNNPMIEYRIPLAVKNILLKYEYFEDANFMETDLKWYFSKSSILNKTKNSNRKKANSTNEFDLKERLLYRLIEDFPTDVSIDMTNKAELPFGYCNSTVMKLKNSMENEKCVRRKAMEKSNSVAYGMVFVAIMMFGVGQSLGGNLGTPLIDDNVKRKSAPYYFAAMRSIRVIGPITGAWLAAGCFKLYVTMQEPPPGLAPSDPRWIGAWWLGFLIVGTLLFIPATMMCFFPKVEFKKRGQRRKELENGQTATPDEKAQFIATEEKPPVEKEIQKFDVPHANSHINIKKTTQTFTQEVIMFCTSLALCLKSPVYIGVLLGRIFDAFAFRGLSSFQPKFIENHYGIPQYQVSFFQGVVGALSYAGGIVLGSIILRKFQLDGRRAAAYCLVCSFLSVVLTVSKVTLKCQSINNAVGKLASESKLNMTSNCNANCMCDMSSLYPVCSKNGTPFYSPCHAGCTNFTYNPLDSINTVFSNCQCADGDVSREYCTSDCTTPLIIFYTISILTGIIAGTAGIPNMLISLRAVPRDVRSVSMAFSGFIVGILSSAPSPIVVGTVIDSACVVWNSVCGRKGACLLYDADVLRTRIHVMYGILRATGLLFDIWVWYWAANLLLLKDPDEKRKKKDSKSGNVLAPAIVNEEIKQ